MKLHGTLWSSLCVALVTLGCPKGDAGPTGPRGDPGTANVIYSAWYSPATWEADTIFGIGVRTYTMTDTSLTQAIIDQGVVVVYMRFAGFNPEIVQLPIVLPFSPAYNFYFQAQAGSLKVVYYSSSTPTTAPAIIPSGNQIRYVLIPGGVLAASMRLNDSTHERETSILRSMSYADMCRTYGIPE